MIKITIKGPTGSGKSTLAEVIYWAILEYQRNQVGSAAVALIEDETPGSAASLDRAKETMTGRHDVLIRVKQR